ncbi:hypothetical protein ABEB36_001825 [Hypothenemus hampei]|uniref:Uncharacterized protein n=1 Tax=Hypothenemus hampei TaxID=57062 RepID=A0ABD1FFZ0_HYPHA
MYVKFLVVVLLLLVAYDFTKVQSSPIDPLELIVNDAGQEKIHEETNDVLNRAKREPFGGFGGGGGRGRLCGGCGK